MPPPQAGGKSSFLHSCCERWRRHTVAERSLATAMVVVLTATLSLLALLVACSRDSLSLRYDTSAGRPAQKHVCTTVECVTSASSMLSKMDLSVDPCEDFYKFSCGTFRRQHTVPDDFYVRSTMQSMQDQIVVLMKKLVEQPVTANDSEAIVKLKRVYNSCTNSSSVEGNSIQTVLAVLAELGPWPMVNPDQWSDDQLKLEYRLAALHSYYVQPFFHMFISPDDRNATSYLVHMSSAALVLNTHYFTNQSVPEHVRYLGAYRGLVRETFRRLGVRNPDPEVAAMLEFETAIAKVIEESDVNNSSVEGDEFVKVTPPELEKTYPQIKWTEMFRMIYQRIGFQADPAELQMVIHSDEFLEKFIQLLNNTSPRTVANYLSWRLLVHLLQYMDLHFRRLYQDFQLAVPLAVQLDHRVYLTRWKVCVVLLNEWFSSAMAAMFVRENPDHGLLSQVRTYVKSLKDAFSRMFDQQSWLSKDLQSLCNSKVALMSEKIAYPPYILDPVKLDSEYHVLNISDEHFLVNVLKIRMNSFLKDLSKIGRPVDKESDWPLTPLTANAYYAAVENAMIVPIGILSAPFFQLGRPNYLNYGGIGVVIGHEITHGFDSSGLKYDSRGNLSQWWPDFIADRFRDRSSCLIDQYSSYVIDEIGENVNGNQTLDDNICDNSGVQQAYKAYLEYEAKNGEEMGLPGLNFTNHQLFFIHYSQIWCEVRNEHGAKLLLQEIHSPGKYRAIGPIVNSQDFSEAFQCPVGSPMNPVFKCQLWS